MKTRYYFRFEKKTLTKLGLIITGLLVSVIISQGQGIGLATTGIEAGYDSKSQVTGFLNEPNSLPVGSIVAMAGEAQPVGYLLCDGRLLNKADYPELYDVLKITYGGTLNSTFKLPDLRGMFLRGWSADNAATDPDLASRVGGSTSKIGSSQSDEYKSHNHTMNPGGDHQHLYHEVWDKDDGNYDFSDDGDNGANSDSNKKTHGDGSHSHIINNSGGNETRPKNIYVAYWIKAKSTVSVNGDATFTKKVKVDGDAEFTKNITLNNATSFVGNIQLQRGLLSDWAALYLVADRDNNAATEDIIFGFNSGVRESVIERMRLKDSNGYLGIGTTNPQENLHVAGKGKFDGGIIIGTSPTVTANLKIFGTAQVKELHIDPIGVWPDYVFTKDYELKSLAEVEAYIQANKHLPEVPSAAKVSQQGYNQSEINATLLKKIEELTLYMIELEKKNEALSKEVQKLKSNR